MDTTKPAPTATRRSLALRGALFTAVAAAAVLGSGGTASATDEFPAAPTASATIACNPGPIITLHLGNLQGLSSAHFVVARTGQPDDAYDVDAFGSVLSYLYGAAEDADTTLTVTGPDGFSYSETWPVDCFDTDGTIVLTCEGEQPVITAALEQVGAGWDYVDLNGVEGGTVQAKAEGPSTVLTGTVPDGVPFSVDVVSHYDQETVATLTGTPDCTPDPTTTTTTEVTTTTVTPTTSTTPPTAIPTTEPTRVLPQQAAPAPAPTVSSGELARTGTATLPLTVTGLTLVGLGIALRRYALRRA